MDLILVRHTRVAAPASTCYGQWDVPLCEPADPPFDDVAARLAALCEPLGAVQRIVSSPLQRAARLAQDLATRLALPWVDDARWMELNFGEWEGRPWHLIPRAESDPWAADYHHRAPPGGETHAALVGRVQAALSCLLATEDPVAAGPCVVVTHAGPIRCLLAAALGGPASQQPDVSLDFGGLVWLRGGAVPEGDTAPRWTVQALNR